jgi:hypothetical protein
MNQLYLTQTSWSCIPLRFLGNLTLAAELPGSPNSNVRILCLSSWLSIEPGCHSTRSAGHSEHLTILDCGSAPHPPAPERPLRGSTSCAVGFQPGPLASAASCAGAVMKPTPLVIPSVDERVAEYSVLFPDSHADVLGELFDCQVANPPRLNRPRLRAAGRIRQPSQRPWTSGYRAPTLSASARGRRLALAPCACGVPSFAARLTATRAPTHSPEHTPTPHTWPRPRRPSTTVRAGSPGGA